MYFELETVFCCCNRLNFPAVGPIKDYLNCYYIHSCKTLELIRAELHSVEHLNMCLDNSLH